MTRAIAFAHIAKAALPFSAAICARLLPDGKIMSGEYVARNPRRNDRNAGSFKINLVTGRWSDFATDDKGGDLVSLVAFVEGVSQLDAARLLSKMLSLKANADE